MTKNEKITELESFVEREIILNQSALVEEALRIKFFLCEDIQNLYRPFDGQLLKPNSCINCGATYGCLDSETGRCEQCYDENKMTQEIYEWWVVSPWLAKRLYLEGEPILENNYGTWWGRCCTGQAIILDDTIEKIFDSITR